MISFAERPTCGRTVSPRRSSAGQASCVRAPPPKDGAEAGADPRRAGGVLMRVELVGELLLLVLLRRQCDECDRARPADEPLVVRSAHPSAEPVRVPHRRALTDPHGSRRTARARSWFATRPMRVIRAGAPPPAPSREGALPRAPPRPQRLRADPSGWLSSQRRRAPEAPAWSGAGPRRRRSARGGPAATCRGWAPPSRTRPTARRSPPVPPQLRAPGR